MAILTMSCTAKFPVPFNVGLCVRTDCDLGAVVRVSGGRLSLKRAFVDGARNMLFNLTDGGTGGIFWGYTVVIIASIPIYLSIGEMASMFVLLGCSVCFISEESQVSHCWWTIPLGIGILACVVSKVLKLHHW